MSRQLAVTFAFLVFSLYLNPNLKAQAVPAQAVPLQVVPAQPAVEEKPISETAPTSADASTETIPAANASSEEQARLAAEKQAEEQWKAQRLQQIQSMSFDRRPSAIFKLWVSKDKPEKPAEKAEEEKTEELAAKPKPAPLTESQQALAKDKENFAETIKLLSESVTLGEWEQLKELLANRERLTEAEAVAAYDRMITQLGSQVGMDFTQVVGLSAEMQQFLQNFANQSQNRPAQAYAEKHSFNFQDLTGILLASPKGLTDIQIRKLANLLRQAVAAGHRIEDFVAQLKEIDTEKFSKQNSALLLSAASYNQFTIDFLPSVEEAKENNSLQELNLLAEHYLAQFNKDRKESFREQAWDVTLLALAIEEGAETDRAQALTRAVTLAPKLRGELGKTWLEESFTKYPERGQEILAKIGTATAQRLAQTPQDATSRQEYIELQHAAVQSFFDAKPEVTNELMEILNLLASNWLTEAKVAYQHSQQSQYGYSMQRDQYGNIYYAQPSYSFEETSQPFRMGQVSPIDINAILDFSPSEQWFEILDESSRPEFTKTICQLWLKVNEADEAFPYIEQLSKTHPETARELAEEFLRVWTKNHNPNAARERTNYYMFMYGYEQKAEKIPLTRSRQERNLQQLSEWIARLKALPLEGEIDEELLVSAFMTCHSVAEVYDVEDIEEIFGTWGSIEPETMAGLIQKMRSNLSSTWRDPNVQRDAKTNRKKTDIQAEVKRGYQVASSVLSKALEQYPDHWQLSLTKACLLHDENDYLQEVAPSSEFSARRQAAFEVFENAAQAYLKLAPELPEREQSTLVFDHWFYAALGATELQGISEKNSEAPGEVEQIAEMLQKMPGELGERHRDQFANRLFTRMSAVSPSCKFRYLEAGFKLVGDNPGALEARKVYDYYKDLVTELELVARLDGSSTVGHEEPFGVYIDLHHTQELEREAGGFSKYLNNQKNMYFSYNYGRPTENYRDKFQDAAIIMLQDHFEVLSVTFNHPETKSRSNESREGWRVTPYAHLLLKARGPEVDKIPGLKLDLDFMDTSGYVVLPISTSPLPIDAGNKSTPSKWSDTELVQVLDERESDKGKLKVEVRATGRGLIPELSHLIETKVPAFKIESTEDSGVSVIEFDQEAEDPIIRSERTWTLHYTAANPSIPTPEKFAFPDPVVDLEKSSYQRYVDADLEETERIVVLNAEYGSNQYAWTIGILLSVAGLFILIGFASLARQRQSASSSQEAVAEEPLTPFTLLTRLRKYAQTVDLSPEQQAALQSDIAQVEEHYFANSQSKAKPDLQQLSAQWS
ncbi:hypothetical protein [Rubinisphaera sp.]|uniref:hypothetical protein n=1 Tax=Rubinisphaera sp. TaxID=2024857 RepID=UPI000C0DD117|nr:hypothetical protein [Rubinisphaera sp.]MBV11353.1 hypothetical protein [Rubinisphaera sp.]HCS51768.1 hypothetical protein [Planctomycetaceae bacterium]